MPEVTGYGPGHPSWVELASPAPEASKDFYRELFGWYVYTLTTDMGDYDIFTLRDVQGPEVAGMQRLQDPEQSPSWTCYFRSDDVSASVDRVLAAGGLELAEPANVADMGRMALCSDLEGADFALWSPYRLQGAGIVDEPSAMSWVELASNDVEGARRFYGEVFGWKAASHQYYGSSYTVWKVEDYAVAGITHLDERWAPGTEPHWMPYFWVADCDASAARAVELGAQLYIEPTDIAPSRFSILADPLGARLGLITPSPDIDSDVSRRAL